jgi:hypothetical protein
VVSATSPSDRNFDSLDLEQWSLQVQIQSDDTPHVEEANKHYFDFGLRYPWLLWPGDSPQTIFNMSNISPGYFCSLTQKLTFTLC